MMATTPDAELAGHTTTAGHCCDQKSRYSPSPVHSQDSRDASLHRVYELSQVDTLAQCVTGMRPALRHASGMHGGGPAV